MADATLHPRSIRSFVLRAGRITAAQQRALTELWPRYGIHYTAAALDLARLFGRDAPRTLEIGFGNGENLAALAAARPERDFLGVEVHRPGVGRLLLSLEARGLANVRIVCHDAVDVLEQQLAPGSLEKILILFPDPWPKKRHHKRRLIQPTFAALLAAASAPAACCAWRPTGSRTHARCWRRSPRSPHSRTSPPTAPSCRGPRSARRRASSAAGSGSATRCGIWRSAACEARRASRKRPVTVPQRTQYLLESLTGEAQHHCRAHAES